MMNNELRWPIAVAITLCVISSGCQQAEPVTVDEALARITDLGGSFIPSERVDGALGFVHLAGTQVTDADLAMLAALPGIGLIDLQRTNVTDAGVAKLASAPGLNRVMLQNTAVTAKGVRALISKARGIRQIDVEGTDIALADLIPLRGLPGAKHVAITPFRWRDVDALATGELTATGWTDSDDGMLSLRLLGPSNRLPRNFPIVLSVEVRNNSDGPVNVRRPFRNKYAAAMNLELSGPNGHVGHCGVIPGFHTTVPPTVELAPGRSYVASMEVSVDMFPGSDRPGRYSIVFNYYRPLDSVELIRSGPLTVTRDK